MPLKKLIETSNRGYMMSRVKILNLEKQYKVEMRIWINFIKESAFLVKTC